MADSAFIREARAGNLLESSLGTLASRKTSNPAVKQFAERMVTDHTAMGNQWAALSAKMGLRAGASLDAGQHETMSHLESLSGAEFDRAYMSQMVTAHQKDVAAFRDEGSKAQSPAVRQLAATSLTTIEQHLTMAQQVASQVGAGPLAANPAAPSRRVTTQGGKVATGDLEADRTYVNEVSQGHIMEVELAHRARDKARDPKVRQFAERMQDDFSKWRDRWTDLGGEIGLSNPHLGHLHQDKVDRLDKASGGQFDRVYLDIVTENLASMVPYFEKEGRAAHSAKVRNLVNDELPSIRENLSRAQELARQIHAGTNPSARERSNTSK